MEVICLQTEAYYTLLQEVIDMVRNQNNEEKEEDWIDTETAMSVLKITSKTTLQKYRDDPDNCIKFSQISSKIILYFKPSLYQFLEEKVAGF